MKIKSKKAYRIDTKFYFVLILFIKENIQENFALRTKFFLTVAKKGKELEYENYNPINQEKIEKLCRTVGAAIFQKKQDYYYAALDDVFQIIFGYKELKIFANHKSIQIKDIKNCLIKNIEENNNLKDVDLFESFFNEEEFDEKLFKHEEQNLFYFMMHRKENNKQ